MKVLFRSFLFTLLFALLYVAMPPITVNAAMSGNLTSTLKWEITDDTLTISGEGSMPSYYYTKVESGGTTTYKTTAPWGDYYKYFSKLVIEEGVTSIGNYAFYYCSNLVDELNLPSTLKSIDAYAFYLCKNLTGDLTIPEGVTLVGSGAFGGCTGFAGNLSLPSSLKVIGTPYTAGAFAGCKNLKGNLILPSNLEKITTSAFSGCSGLTGDLHLPEGLIQLGESAFSGCSGLTGSLIIPRSITSISSHAFANCTGLTGELTIPDTVTYIGDYAFQHCSGLTGDIIIPDSVTRLNSHAFYGCSGFDGTLTLPTNVSMTKIPEYCFSGCSGLSGTLDIPDQITEIAYGAFKDCSGFTGTLIIPDSVVTIGKSTFNGYTEQGVFQNCTGFTSVQFGAGTKTIGYQTFKGCTGLSGAFVLPDTVTLLGDYSFCDCTGLTSLTIPAAVTSVGSSIIRNSGVDTVIFVGDAPVFNTYTFSTATVTAYYPPANDTWSEDVKLQYGGTVNWLTWTCDVLQRDHMPGEITYENVIDATCQAGGSYTEKYTCTYCQEVFTEHKTTSQLPHSEELLPAVEPTCGESGLTEGSQCTACATILVPQTVVPATGNHQYDLDPRVEPTCTDNGLTAGSSCHVCGYIHLAQENIPALGHTEVVDTAVAPTCTATGLTEGKHCSVCDAVIVSQVILPMSDHTEEIAPAVESTCSATGLTEGSYCKICNEVLIAQEPTAKKPHTVALDDPKAPTCTTPGLNGTGIHCSVCQEVLVAQEEVPALGHTMSKTEAKAPTCEEAGNMEYYACPVCEKYFFDADGKEPMEENAWILPVYHPDENKDKVCDLCKEILEGHEHSYAVNVTVPTCTAAGYTTYTCACGDTKIDDEVEAAGHSGGTATCKVLAVCGVCGESYGELAEHTVVLDEAVAPNCENTGLTEGKHCSVCNEVLVAQTEVDALGHTEVVDAAVAPDCENTGLSEGKHCSLCNKVLVAQTEVDALGHTVVIDAAVAATCTTDGLTEGSHCKICNKTLQLQSSIPATDHRFTEAVFTWANNLTSATASAQCHCGHVEDATCTLCWDTIDKHNVGIIASAILGETPFTERKIISATAVADEITVTLPDTISGLLVLVARYSSDGQMIECRILEISDNVFSVPNPGSALKVFFVTNNYAPISHPLIF